MMNGQRSVVLIGCAVIASTVAFSAFLALARHFAIGSASLDYAALGVSVALGMPFVWLVPRRLWLRLLLCVVLAAVLAAWLVFYGVGFVCSVYRDCL